jgi:hypothetical protein
MDVNDLREVVSRVENMYKTVKPELRARYSIFYSHPFFTLRKGTIYYLGLNPGGELGEKDYEREDVSYWNNKPYDYSAYMEKWGNHDPGKAPLQIKTRVLLGRLLNRLGDEKNDFRTVFSTNSFFFRSPNTNILAAQLGGLTCGHTEIIDSCIVCGFWHFHKEWLEKVHPKVIVCNGNAERLSAYMFMRSRLASTNGGIQIEPKKIYGTFYLKAFHIKRPYWDEANNVTVLGIPHLSHFEPNDTFWDEVNKILT